jgi:hypothetical protein
MYAGIAFTGSGIQLNGSIFPEKRRRTIQRWSCNQRALGPLSRDSGEKHPARADGYRSLLEGMPWSTRVCISGQTDRQVNGQQELNGE